MTNDLTTGVPAEPERLHALDAVRAGALMLGVVFHAVLSFMEPPLWVVVDESTSPVMSSVYFILHIFRMTVFFIIAGFFARMMLHKRGTGGFVRNRAKRILAPFLIFWPVMMVSTVLVIFWAAAQSGQEQPPPPPFTPFNFPLTHLWFLYYLLVFYVFALIVRGVLHLVDRQGGLRARVLDPIVRGLVRTDLAPIVLGAPLVLTLVLSSDWKAWFGVPAAENGVIPNIGALLAYTIAFGFGWVLQRQPDLLQVWAGRYVRNLVLAVLLTGYALYQIGTQADPALSPTGSARWIYAVTYVLAIWTWAMGLIGAALALLTTERKAVRYVADGSYWIYILHLPLIMALQAAFMRVPLPWAVKYPLILLIAFPVLLLSYEYLVRYTFLGRLLNGRRRHRERAAAKPVEAVALAAAE
ncbi:acyltransferase family protein [Catellatospora sp. KI3]|uniref:acyltransferase family protein n=1 Tax=Catellatospora sp. KI3 TaxID=3041620 RepID=UPI0024828C6E|nr:acyltransferase family protein [Catellatospora sp. KI3]MDI1461457.1 acyltransferase family protein [Catellatospora sp. KI3]